MNNSKNILGFKDDKSHKYIHIGNRSEALVKLSKNMHNTNAYLVSTNAAILKNEKEEDGFSMELSSYLPIRLELNIPKNCHYQFTNIAPTITKKGNIISFSYKYKTKVGFNVKCKP